MNQKQIDRLKEMLNDRFAAALDEEKEQCTKLGKPFDENDPWQAGNKNAIAYRAMITTIETIGMDWKRNNGRHTLYK